MFIGEFEHALDNKSRVIIPAKFREELEEQFVLLQSADECIRIISIDLFQAEVQEAASRDMKSEANRRIARLLGAGANFCSLDKQGRVTIPQKLKRHAKITKDVYVIGSLTEIQIWGKEVYETMLEDPNYNLASAYDELIRMENKE